MRTPNSITVFYEHVLNKCVSMIKSKSFKNFLSFQILSFGGNLSNVVMKFKLLVKKYTDVDV